MLRVLLLLVTMALAHGYHVVPSLRTRATMTKPAVSVRMADDNNLADMAMAAIDNVLRMCQECDPPKALIGVKNALEEGEQLAIGNAMYLLLVEQCLDFDPVEDPQAEYPQLQPTTTDWKNLEDPKVKEKLGYVYNYGIGMFQKGMISEDALKDAVLSKVAARVDMDGPAFDQWLQIPAVTK